MPITVVARMPWPFLGRLGLAFAEIVFAATTLAGSVIVGHELKEWRDWFWDSGTARIWAPTPKPSPSAPADFAAPE
jgi:hypothetical protein